MNIRKLKRRAMARMSDPRIEVRLPALNFQFFAGMTSIGRENCLRKVLKEYVDYRLGGSTR